MAPKASPWFDEEDAAAETTAEKQYKTTKAKRTKSQVAFPAYQKTSSQAEGFRKAFASARKAGNSDFVWEGRKYNTKIKGE